MASLYSQIQGYFQRDEWPIELNEAEQVLQTGFRSEDTPNMWTCYAQALEEDQQFLFYSMAPVEVPPAMRTTVAEYLTRANFGLVLGNFEIDLDTGVVRFKTSIDVEDDRLSYELWRPIVYANVFVMERYLPGLLAIVHEDASVAEAIRQAETAE